MSGPTIYGSNGKEQFTSDNPAIVKLALGADPTTGVLKVKIDSTDVQLPIQIQSRLNTPFQTHNNVLIPPSTWSEYSGWADCSKADKIAVNVANDAITSTIVQVIWSFDQNGRHGVETVIPSGALQQRSGIIDVKAPYYKISVKNEDTATSHTMNVNNYLKS